MSYIEGTILGEIIDRCVDNWANLFGFVDAHDREREDDLKKYVDKVIKLDKEGLFTKSPKKKATRKKRVKKNK
jgi:hypothetical protein